MPVISLKHLLDHAAEHNYAVPAFNINNLEQIKGVMEAANKVNSPVIMQASIGAKKYAGKYFLHNLLRAAVQEYPHIPVVIHQDHGASVKICQDSIALGFSSVMIDGSLAEDQQTPTSLEYNINITKAVTKIAHATGVSVEGELGCLGSLETGFAGEEDGSGAKGKLNEKQLLTDPLEALEFVRKTNIDALAIAIGTSHGAYKFTKVPDGNILDIDRIKEIHDLIPNTHLVLHGASSVPSYLIDIINKYGGDLPTNYFGVPIAEIQKAIGFGIRKINIDTDLRLAITAAIRKYLYLNPSEFDPRKYNVLAKEATINICVDRYKSFNSANQASQIKITNIKYFL